MSDVYLVVLGTSLHVLLQQVLQVEGLVARGTRELLVVGGQVVLQLHLTGERLRTEQTPA